MLCSEAQVNTHFLGIYLLVPIYISSLMCFGNCKDIIMLFVLWNYE
jgi:hypothetical protein